MEQIQPGVGGGNASLCERQLGAALKVSDYFWVSPLPPGHVTDH